MMLHIVSVIVCVLIGIMGAYIYVEKLSRDDDLGSKCFACGGLTALIIGLVLFMADVLSR